MHTWFLIFLTNNWVDIIVMQLVHNGTSAQWLHIMPSNPGKGRSYEQFCDLVRKVGLECSFLVSTLT